MVIWGTRDEKRRIIRSSKNLSDQKLSSFHQQQSVSISVAFHKPIFKNNNGSFGKAVKCFFISIEKAFLWALAFEQCRLKISAKRNFYNGSHGNVWKIALMNFSSSFLNNTFYKENISSWFFIVSEFWEFIENIKFSMQNGLKIFFLLKLIHGQRITGETWCIKHPFLDYSLEVFKFYSNF